MYQFQDVFSSNQIFNKDSLVVHCHNHFNNLVSMFVTLSSSNMSSSVDFQSSFCQYDQSCIPVALSVSVFPVDVNLLH